MPNADETDRVMVAQFSLSLRNLSVQESPKTSVCPLQMFPWSADIPLDAQRPVLIQFESSFADFTRWDQILCRHTVDNNMPAGWQP